MSFIPSLQKIRDLVPKGQPRPFDLLQRGEPFREGLKAVSAMETTGQDPENSLLLKAAFFLYFDGFEEAHLIAQDHEGVAGNWIHAILHRREPDAGNSKYWYHRVPLPGTVHQAIHEKVMLKMAHLPIPELAGLARKMEMSKGWEPEAFVDLVDQVRKENPASPLYRLLVEIQEVEWRGLLDHLMMSKDSPRKHRG